MDLEPWNMFTTDFNASDQQSNAENSAMDECMGGYYGDNGLTPAAAEATRTRTSDALASEENGEEQGVNNNQDDNAIFNFGDFYNDSTLEDNSMELAEGVESSPMGTKTKTNGGGIPVKYERYVIYICPACGIEFPNQSPWKAHLNSAHNFGSREGLNFVQLDRLYHECLECYKRIAMHSMENLLKHKFTHLPYRCAKCAVCHREYKYRQDLMVHLRMTHHEYYAKHEHRAREREEEIERDQEQLEKERQVQRTVEKDRQMPQEPQRSLTIGEVQENAFDFWNGPLEFGDEDAGDDDDLVGDDIEVKNELLVEDGEDDDDNAIMSFGHDNTEKDDHNEHEEENSLLMEALTQSNSKTNLLKKRPPLDKNFEEFYEKHIQYVCPQCGNKMDTNTEWRLHIEQSHDLTTREGLNFTETSNYQAQCIECDKVVVPNSIPILQHHKFSHLPFKPYRCRLCLRSCVGHKDIIKHLNNQHRFGQRTLREGGVENDASYGGDGDALGSDDDAYYENGEEDMDESLMPKRESRDIYEKHIDYLCPECGKEIPDRKAWRKHIVRAHHLTDLKILNFKVINDREVECIECNKIITNAYGVQNAQQHRFTHMPFKSFIRCRLCVKSYTDRKGAVKHLRTKHRIGKDFDSVARAAARATAELMAAKRRAQERKSEWKHDRSGDDHFAEGLADEGPQVIMKSQAKEVVRCNGFIYEIKYLAEEQAKEKCASPTSFQLSCGKCNINFDSHEDIQQHFKIVHNKLMASDEADAPLLEDPVDDSNSKDLLISTGHTHVAPESPHESQGMAANYCFLCPSCGLECKNKRSWRYHMNEVHNFDKRQYLSFKPLDRYRYKCLICNETVQGALMGTLLAHKIRHLPHRLFIKCLVCGVCYNTTPNMEKHLLLKHNIGDRKESTTRTLPASSSSSSSSTFRPIKPPPAALPPPQPSHAQSVFTYHASYLKGQDHETIEYYCPQCNQQAPNHIEWRMHIVEAHRLNTLAGLDFRRIDDHHYLCLQCYKWVTVTHTKGAISQLQSHKFRHLPFKSFKCTSCQGEFVRKQMYFKHLNKKTKICNAKIVAANDTEATKDKEDTKDKEFEDREEESDVKDEDNNSSRIKNIKPEPKEDIQDEENGNEQGAGDGHDSDGDSSNDLLMPRQHSASPTTAEEAGVGSSPHKGQYPFTFLCPQCGQQFTSNNNWREHINFAHNLGKREMLRFRRLDAKLHECLECQGRVSGVKLRDLQLHHFKHLPYGSAYIQCVFCPQAYNHWGSAQDHIRNRHPEQSFNPQHINDNADAESGECGLWDVLKQYEDISLGDISELNEDFDPSLMAAEMLSVELKGLDDDHEARANDATDSAAAEDDHQRDDHTDLSFNNEQFILN